MNAPAPEDPKTEASYFSSVVGRVNRHRLIAFFVCAPLAVLALRLFGRGPLTAAAVLRCVLFAVAAYSSGAAAVSAWPSKRKQALAGEPPTALQIWLFRALSILCALLALCALLGVWISVRGVAHPPAP